MPLPTASRSAVMLRAFAPIRPTRSTPRIGRHHRPRRFLANSPRPLPVANAVRSQIS